MGADRSCRCGGNQARKCASQVRSAGKDSAPCHQHRGRHRSAELTVIHSLHPPSLASAPTGPTASARVRWQHAESLFIASRSLLMLFRLPISLTTHVLNQLAQVAKSSIGRPLKFYSPGSPNWFRKNGGSFIPQGNTIGSMNSLS